MSALRSIEAELRGRVLRTLNLAVETGGLSRDEALCLLDKVDQWSTLLDRLSERTQEKWRAEDALNNAIREAKVAALREAAKEERLDSGSRSALLRRADRLERGYA